MHRRAFIKALGIAAAAAPLAAVRELTKPEPPADLPTFTSGDVLTADSWNDLTERVNLLSRNLP